MIHEDVINAFQVLGFMPEPLEGGCLQYDYEGMPVIYSRDDSDPRCLTLMTPDVFDVSEVNRLAVYVAMAELCGTTKFVQPHIMFGSQVWLNYQHYLLDEEVKPELVEHMIRVLAYATKEFHKIINEKNG